MYYLPWRPKIFMRFAPRSLRLAVSNIYVMFKQLLCRPSQGILYSLFFVLLKNNHNCKKKHRFENHIYGKIANAWNDLKFTSMQGPKVPTHTQYLLGRRFFLYISLMLCLSRDIDYLQCFVFPLPTVLNFNPYKK